MTHSEVRPQRPPARPTARPTARIAVAAAAVVGTASVVAATLVVARVFGPACSATATGQRIWEGQQALLGVVLVALLPWAVAASRTQPRSPRRVRLLVAAMICASPAAAALVVGLDHGIWRTVGCV